MISTLELHKRLQYDPYTGRWTWLNTTRSGFNGKPAGSLDAKGYWIIKIDGQSYKASRLAHLYMTGKWPKNEMDHIDSMPWNDVWTNLRPATRAQNNANRRKRKDNKSGAIGVFWNAQSSKWQAQVDKVHIGLFDSLEEAIAARDLAVSKLHGNFAVLNRKETAS